MQPNPITVLLGSAEPSLHMKARLIQTGGNPPAGELAHLQEQVRSSERVQRLLAERSDDGRIPLNPYNKWRGAHWVLAILADLGYPSGDASLIPLREQVLEWLLSSRHRKDIPTLEGRTRRCASQEGNAVYAQLTLGLADERTDELVQSLIIWQWPDGGWNCDRRPAAQHSSFWESLIPLRALALHARLTGASISRAAAERAAEVFLTRRLFRRRSDGTLMNAQFAQLHYPCYWRYDILFALKVMAEAGYIGDPRCGEALELLETKKLPTGGFAAEARFYRPASGRASGQSTVDWGPVGRARMNPWVTADALYVLQKAGRLPADS